MPLESITDVQIMTSIHGTANIIKSLDSLDIPWPQSPFPSEIKLPKDPVIWDSIRGHILLFRKTDSDTFSNILEDSDGNTLALEYEPVTCIGIDANGEFAAISAHPLRDRDIIRSLGFDYALEPETNETKLGSFLNRMNKRLQYPDILCGHAIDKHSLYRAVQYQTQKLLRDRCDLKPVKYLPTSFWQTVYTVPKQPDMTFENMLRGGYTNILIKRIIDETSLQSGTLPGLTEDMTRFLKNIHHQKNVWHRPETRRRRPNDQDFSENYMDDPVLAPSTTQIWDIITNVGRPDFCRYTDNRNTNTFDYIELRIGIRQYADAKERASDVKACIKDMVKMGLQKIKKSRSFIRFNIPISFVKCTRYVITQQSEVVLTYELRQPKT